MVALYSKNTKNGPVKKAIRSRIPVVNEVLWAGKRALGSPNALAHYIMRVESNLIVKLVGNELRKARIPALTVHDCVIVKRQDAEQVEGIVRATGKEYLGMEPVLKAESLSRQICAGVATESASTGAIAAQRIVA